MTMMDYHKILSLLYSSYTYCKFAKSMEKWREFSKHYWVALNNHCEAFSEKIYQDDLHSRITFFNENNYQDDIHSEIRASQKKICSGITFERRYDDNAFPLLSHSLPFPGLISTHEEPLVEMLVKLDYAISDAHYWLYMGRCYSNHISHISRQYGRLNPFKHRLKNPEIEFQLRHSYEKVQRCVSDISPTLCESPNSIVNYFSEWAGLDECHLGICTLIKINQPIQFDLIFAEIHMHEFVISIVDEFFRKSILDDLFLRNIREDETLRQFAVDKLLYLLHEDHILEEAILRTIEELEYLMIEEDMVSIGY